MKDKETAMLQNRARTAAKAKLSRVQRLSKKRRALPPPGGFLVVALGASAGGLEALNRLFDALPADTGMAYVLIQHLDPTHKSMMVDLLASHTAMAVLEAANGMPIEPNHVYVIPPGSYLAVEGGAFRVTQPRERHGARMPFDHFLRSLGEDRGVRAACVVLSGTGSDGSLGIKAIHEKGGLVIVQDPNDAGHAGMPRSAIDTGLVDAVLPATAVPAYLLKHGSQERLKPELVSSPRSSDDDAALAEIFALLRAHTSRDFALYKEGTLLRQIQRRMNMASSRDVGSYLEKIRKTPKEIDLLAKDMLINVTRFFRDAKAFDILAETVIPELVGRQPSDQPIRVWDAGCSSGEETYSIVMLFLEKIGSAKKNVKLQVFASDVDDQAVTAARNGLYPMSIEADVSVERLARFFVKEPNGYRVTRELREAVVFATQDLLADAPFSRLDLVCCRNVFIYLRPEVQEKVLSLFHFALREGGILILGASEAIGSLANRFEPISRKQRIFRHVSSSRPGEVRFPIAPAEGPPPRSPALAVHPVSPRAKAADVARQALLETHAPASVLIDAARRGVHFFGPVGRYLTVAEGEGNPDIFAMARKGLRIGLRATIRQAERDPTCVAVGSAQADRDGASVGVEISVRPVQAEGRDFLLVSFVDKANLPSAGNDASEPADVPRIVALEQELDVTQKEREGAVRDLEITNDELTASNEEAMSVNEELQSTNEELETSKEELQSLNEELTALNSQLNETIERQRATADDLQNTMNSSDIATLFLDTELRIRLFTPAAKSMFNVMLTDVGRPLADLARLTNDARLIDDARKVLADHLPLSCDVESNDGAWYTRRITPYRTTDDRVQGVVVTLTDISERKLAERAITAARAYSDSIIDTIRQPLIVLDEGLRVISASPSFYATFSVGPEETVGRELGAVDDGRLDVAQVHRFVDGLGKKEKFSEDQEIEIELPALGLRSLLVSAREIREDPNAVRKILVTFDDITERKKASEALVAAKHLAERANIAKSTFLAAASHDLRQPLQTLTLVQGLLAKRIKDEGNAKLIAKLEETLGAMSGMLNTLLDINQLEAGVVRPETIEFPIGTLLERLKTEFAYHASAKGLRWRVVASDRIVRSDPRLLEQMIRNLLANAIKYTEQGKVLLGCRLRGRKLRIEVWDTGIGIPAGQLKAVFGEFHQLDNPARERNRGLGLGLSIVQRIGDLMEHEVSVRSWLGRGSVFVIDVPVVETKQPAQPTIGGVESEAAASATGMILVVEDDPAVREMLEILFEAEGHRTTSVATSNAVLALAAKRALAADVIVADYNLPGVLTGTEVVARVRATLRREIPAIILTGDISSDALRRIRHANCVHISKPATADALTGQVRRLLDVERLAAPPAAAPKPAAAASGPIATIFIVDDDHTLRDDMQKLLQAHGWTVEAYASGAEFLATSPPDRTGCLLVDAVMPGMSGIEMLERLKAEGRQLSTVMITGYGDLPTAIQAMRAGAADFLEKPIRMDQLLASIERALDQARDWPRSQPGAARPPNALPN